MTFTFSLFNFRFCGKFWAGFLYRDQQIDGRVLSRSVILFEMGVREFKYYKVYYFGTLCFYILIERFDKNFVPKWLSEPTTDSAQELGDICGGGGGKIIQFSRRNKNV